MTVSLEVMLSLVVVAGVLWWMWRLPQDGEPWFAWAPPLALASAWLGLSADVVGVLLWIVSSPDSWLPIVLLLLAPGAIAAGLLVLWIYRRVDQPTDTVSQQKLQATVGVLLGVLAIAAGYLFVLIQKRPFTPIGM